MPNFRIIVSYDGSRYKGWQVQKKEENTIQGKFQNILGGLSGQPVEVIGSGRTDAGVHAAGQTANFHLSETALQKLQQWNQSEGGREEGTAAILLKYLNRYLPEDIAVISCEKAEEDFHSRYHARSKTYRYRISVSEIPDVFERRYVYRYRDYDLDITAMELAAQQLVGKHDFASFCGNRHMKKSTVRTIFSIDICRRGPEIIIDYTGDGFLQNMVRILTGTLIEVGSGRRDPSSMKEILAAGDRSMAGYTAPAQGLILMKVNY